MAEEPRAGKPMLPVGALRGSSEVPVLARVVSPQSTPLTTPMNVASSRWRTQTCPYAPARVKQAAVDNMTPMSVSDGVLCMPTTSWPSPSNTPMSTTSPMCTPSNVATAHWRKDCGIFAPARKEQAHFGPIENSSNPFTSNGLPNVGAVFMPMAEFVVAPEPQWPYERKRPASLDITSSSYSASPIGTPLNTAFIASPTAFQGGQSPFFADATPIAALPGASPTNMSDFGWIAQHQSQLHTNRARAFSLKAETVPEDAEPIFGIIDPNRARELGA